MINTSARIFSADPKYREYCTNYAHSESKVSPRFVSPEEVTGGGGGGGGGSGGGGGGGGDYSPTPDLPEDEIFLGHALSISMQASSNGLASMNYIATAKEIIDLSLQTEVDSNPESIQVIGNSSHNIHYSLI